MKYKHLNLKAAELKFDDESRTIEGYASTFGNVDSYGDTIAPGAYTKTLQSRERPIRMRWNHFGPVIGKWTELREDEKGLWVKGQLTPGHSVAENVYASLKHGAVDGLSIGFYASDIEEKEDARLLKEIELIEISVVEEPADLGAKISGVKEFAELVESVETLKDAEACLRDACGLSRSAATALVARIKTLTQSESGSEQRQSDSDGAATLNWRMYRALILKR